MRKCIVVISIALALLAGCTAPADEEESGGGTTAAGGSTEPGSTAPADPAELERAPGVTDDAIKVGVTYLDADALKGVADVSQGDYEASYQALFDDLNADGGVHGRQIEPVFATVSPLGTEPADEVCLQLTEDEEVFAAIGFFYADAPLCFVETHQTALIGGAMSPERLERAQAPWFTTEAGTDLEADTIRTFAEEGLLDDPFAVFTTVNDEGLLTGTVEPLLDELGLEPVDTGILDAPDDDFAAQDAATAVIAERFESAGAETVLVIGGGGLGWARGTQPTDYRPQTLYTTRGAISAYVDGEADRDEELLETSLVGGIYAAPAGQALEAPNMEECLGIMEDAGLDLVELAELDAGTNVGKAEPNACAAFTLFTAILEGAGEDLTYASFREAGNTLGEITIPGNPDPFTYGPPPAADGDPKVRIFEWDSEVGDYVVQD